MDTNNNTFWITFLNAESMDWHLLAVWYIILISRNFFPKRKLKIQCTTYCLAHYLPYHPLTNVFCTNRRIFLWITLPHYHKYNTGLWNNNCSFSCESFLMYFTHKKLEKSYYWYHTFSFTHRIPKSIYIFTYINAYKNILQ